MVHVKSTPRQTAAMPYISSGSMCKVAHQRVSIDVDLSKHLVSGFTEIIIIPLIQQLEYVSFDCKNMRVKDVIVENRRIDHYVHDDPYKQFSDRYVSAASDPLRTHNGVRQSHFLRSKLAEFSEAPEDSAKSQLLIKIPSSVKITLQDTASLSSYTPITPSIRTPAQESIFSPITIRIDYELSHPHSGLHFDTASSEPQYWNCYTTNTEYNSSVSHWVPCVDLLDEKCTWELEISVPKTVREIGTTKIIGAQPQRKRKLRSREYIDDEDEDDEELEPEEETEDSPLDRDMVVVCSEFATAKESAHPTDMAKKVVSFQIFNPVAPHHVGWAVGSFAVWSLPSLQSFDEQDDEQEDQGNNIQVQDDDDIVPIQIYTLPMPDINEATVLNTTLVCQSMMDFYSKEFGSYPFSSYAILFLPTLPDNTMDFASLSLCSTRLLYPPELIDPMFTTTNTLAWALASQWSGVNITPLELNDMWCCIGMAGYMALQFTRKLMGINEFKYRLKMASEAIVAQDWEKPPMARTFNNASMPVSSISRDIDFIKLKAPMVLYILDRRMTKTERSFGMSRVLPKIYLQAMSGDLSNNSLSTAHFQYVCERVNRSKLEQFFAQWVFGSGVPVFRITQRFNKKRMVVEMGIRQVQLQELGQGHIIGKRGFHASAMDYLCHPDKQLTQIFTGSMTIRIHEADGTPYEHIVELKDVFTKLDIQYNTKYKRLKRRRKINKPIKPDGKEASIVEPLPKDEDMKILDEDNDDIVLVNCLGDTLLSREDCQHWNLTDPAIIGEDDESQQQNEAFEWIRVDADFEWICKVYINQPDYMFASQLQQDRDVEAQIESIRFFEDVVASSAVNSQVYSSILTRTVMDDRYFYGVRLEACNALSKFILKEVEPNQFSGGARHLIAIFRYYFCYENSNIQKNNDFTDFSRYFIQCAIPRFLANTRDTQGKCPTFVKRFLLELLRYNDNSGNPYSDVRYVVAIIDSVVACTLGDPEDKEYINDLLNELKRFENLDRWLPSYQLLVSKAILKQYLLLAVDGVYKYDDLENILEYTVVDHISPELEGVVHIREGLQDLCLTAFTVLLLAGGIKNKEILKYFFENMCFHGDPYIRTKLCDVLIDCLNFIALKGSLDDLDEDVESLVNSVNSSSINDRGEPSIFVEDYNSDLRVRREQHMRSSIRGLISLVRTKFEKYEPLQKILWDVLHSPLLSVYQRKRLFDLLRVMYRLEDSFFVTLPSPRDKVLIAKDMGKGIIILKREGILKVHLPPKPPTVHEAHSRGAAVPRADPAADSPKIKLSLSKKTRLASTAAAVQPAAAKRAKAPAVTKSPQRSRAPKSTVTKLGALPLRYVKIVPEKRKVDISAVPFNKSVSILKATATSCLMRIKVPKDSIQPKQT
ncbi:AFR674Cp [Eremothecium gossypii ATCC 10895]|uniref:Transcription initiation factor TFIID subunit 2 n=1 Tax=Eremothecium gossypii (strain ATCC 10895 / CBS 109.51 / FGSC 9923 / NRRL Y-1056) TaxID=284811 RepID=Q752A1_EREGS|nr:AFR674Cp [Eremothecium gossypii ATCC 10895]AAS54046.1 AFR674Cp [Eremothecium gossypii ATCC 10895]AEY98361.1 FAFR674Cp [Eremothecium gossypii FDAG1]